MNKLRWRVLLNYWPNITHINDLGSAEDLILHPAMTKSFMRPHLVLQSEESCRECEYFHICKGGCAYEAIVGTGNRNRKTKFCEVYKALYGQIKSDLIAIGKKPQS
ncbi:MAG: SPASM domain-containing protein [Nanoarchaeota archaeon]